MSREVEPELILLLRAPQTRVLGRTKHTAFIAKRSLDLCTIAIANSQGYYYMYVSKECI